MSGSEVIAWQPSNVTTGLDQISDINTLTGRALQLRARERAQITTNFNAGNFEIVATYVWTRTMALLKKQLATLGSSFIGELLQRADIDEHTDIRTSVSETEAISLARDLGMLTPTQTMRLLQSQAVISHFAGATDSQAFGDDEVLTQEEAISCLRVCVQGVLGQQHIEAAKDFQAFRNKLSTETLASDAIEIVHLHNSPYFFVRTAVSVLLTLVKTTKGSQFEHVTRNISLIVPLFWPKLKDPERWQIGQAYALEFNEGRKDSLKSLHSVLLSVKGFDYVPENLRSATFDGVASRVIAAHQGMNNFYNEPAPMNELASLGSSIPGPALAQCMTAVLCVKIGNMYGFSTNAQPAANEMLKGISLDRWVYYLNGRLENDHVILSELTSDRPIARWISLISPLDIPTKKIENVAVRRLIDATAKKDVTTIRTIAANLYRKSLGVKD